MSKNKPKSFGTCIGVADRRIDMFAKKYYDIFPTEGHKEKLEHYADYFNTDPERLMEAIIEHFVWVLMEEKDSRIEIVKYSKLNPNNKYMKYSRDLNENKVVRTLEDFLETKSTAEINRRINLGCGAKKILK